MAAPAQRSSPTFNRQPSGSPNSSAQIDVGALDTTSQQRNIKWNKANRSSCQMQQWEYERWFWSCNVLLDLLPLTKDKGEPLGATDLGDFSLLMGFDEDIDTILDRVPPQCHVLCKYAKLDSESHEEIP
uniref:Uncharacterized protein n=1 Tax=Oryza punctata TaxID=4537 RepID=A0A0E0M5L9_ORYPU